MEKSKKLAVRHGGECRSPESRSDHWAMPPFSPAKKHNGELEDILVPHHLAYTTGFVGVFLFIGFVSFFFNIAQSPFFLLLLKSEL